MAQTGITMSRAPRFAPATLALFALTVSSWPKPLDAPVMNQVLVVTVASLGV